MIKFTCKILLFVLLFGLAYGFAIPNYEGYVTDMVGVFSETEKADLTQKIESIQEITRSEIAILVVPTVDDDINLAAVDVGRKRGVGKKDQNNGIVILLAITDKRWSIQVGYGLEGTLPDLMTKKIAEARFPENFRAGNYYQGVSEVLDDISGYMQQDPTVMEKYAKAVSSSKTPLTKNYIEFAFIIFFIVIGGFGRWVTVPSNLGPKRKMKKHGRLTYAGAGLLFTYLITFFVASIVAALFISYISLLFAIGIALSGGGGPGTGIGGGNGGSSWGGKGGFGGFGGGSFGGGGSSGGW